MNPNEEKNTTPPLEPKAPAPQTPPLPNGSNPIGPIVGIVIVVVLLVLGALYYFWYRPYSEMQESSPSPEEIRTQSDPALNDLQTQSTGDAVSSIEADLEASNFDAIDAELDQIDAELGL